MARMSAEELYHGEGSGSKYESGGIMGAVTKEMLIVKYTLAAAEKLKNEGDTVSVMTGVGSPSSYVGRTENDNT